MVSTIFLLSESDLPEMESVRHKKLKILTTCKFRIGSVNSAVTCYGDTVHFVPHISGVLCLGLFQDESPIL